MKEEIKGDRLLNGVSKHVTIRNLKGINILLGKNGTGKSSFLRNLYQTDYRNYYLIVPERGGSEMTYNSSYADQENNEDQKKQSRQRNFDRDYRIRVVSRASMILNRGGYLLYSGIKTSNLCFQDISNLFRIFLPEFKVEFSTEIPYNLKIYREDELGNYQDITSADQVSSGEAEAFSLATDIITQSILWEDEEKILLIDEPDTHLHIDLENRFAIFINEIRNQFNLQVIIATHSNSLVASLLNVSEDVGIICFDTKQETISTIPLSQNRIFANLLSIDLSLAVILGKKILIIEGNDDFLVWNQAIRSQNLENLALIQANGNDIYDYKKNAEKILKVVLDTPTQRGVTLLDKDNQNDPQNNPADILPYLRLQCYSLENLFFTNEVLHYIKEDLDLERELLDLQNNLSNPDEKSAISCIINDKQFTKIPKELVHKVCQKIDPYSSSRDWRIILGKVLGKSRPSGELATFLGKDLVNYIWGEETINLEEN